MIRAGVRADGRQQGMIAGSHFSRLFSLFQEKIHLLKRHPSSVLRPGPSKNTNILFAALHVLLKGWRVQMEAGPMVTENLNVQALVPRSLSSGMPAETEDPQNSPTLKSVKRSSILFNFTH